MDISKLTLGEIATVEELSNSSISALASDTAPKARLFTALAFVLKKRENPKFTFNEAEALTFDDVNSLLGLGSTDDKSGE